jgi:hypothetical protein
MWNGEHNVEITGVEQFLLPCLKPSFASLGLALGAVAIAAGNGELSIMQSVFSVAARHTEALGMAGS